MRVKLIAREHSEYGVGFVPKFHENWFERSDFYLPITSRFGHDLIDHVTARRTYSY